MELDQDPSLAHHRELSMAEHPGGAMIAPIAAQPPTAGPSRKRKKNADSADTKAESEPRRLRRSHEACARCRGKKIKCDSQHPRCGACAAAGVVCHQEDRHRQTLTPRGHTDKLERQLAQCEALLRKLMPDGFDLNQLDAIMAREGLDVEYHGPPPQPFAPPPPGQRFPLRDINEPPQPGPPGPYMPYPPGYGPHPHHLPPHMAMPPNGPVMRHPMPYGMQAPYAPPYPPQAMHYLPQPQVRTVGDSVKGQDPQSNDMSNTQSLAKNFGVNPNIAEEIKPAEGVFTGSFDKEDLAVGGLSTGRDKDLKNENAPRDAQKWIFRSFKRTTMSATGKASNSPLVLYLPRDRSQTNRVVDYYFERLNVLRPVFFRHAFQKGLDELYDDTIGTDDPGFLCSVYLVLALGTLSEVNHTFHSGTNQKHLTPDWPEYDEFFERAMGVKPELRLTVSSLQALILLHWYLYTERHGRTLWRLVGNLVRLAVELGLHHNPYDQPGTFTDEECELRIRLWWIVMIHDRGTAILLGRPLAISEFDYNTPGPTSGPGLDDHFVHSRILLDIQGDMINSLYRPAKQSADTLLKHATRIMNSLSDFKSQMDESFQPYFNGTENWTEEQRTTLASEITEGQGVTLLKYGIARMLLDRALFNAKEIPFKRRVLALDDGVIMSHNVIAIHSQLINYPDIAFFVSPIPLHIAAMTILYGVMSKSERLSRTTAMEDVHSALALIPHFRWRWERRDSNGGAHPLIHKLAVRVFPELGMTLGVTGPSMRGVIIKELEWEDSTPTSANTPVSSPDQSLLQDVPRQLFYPGPAWIDQPLEQEWQGPSSTPGPVGKQGGNAGGMVGNGAGGPEDVQQMLAQLPQQGLGDEIYQPSHELYVQEERDPAAVGPPPGASLRLDPNMATTALGPYVRTFA